MHEGRSAAPPLGHPLRPAGTVHLDNRGPCRVRFCRLPHLCVNRMALAIVEGDDLTRLPRVAAELVGRRCGEPRGARCRLVWRQIQVTRLGRVAVDQRDGLLVGRQRVVVPTGRHRQSRPRPAGDRHRIHLVLAGVHFGRGEVPRRAIARHSQISQLEIAAGQGRRLPTGQARGVEVEEAGALGQEVDVLIVRHEAVGEIVAIRHASGAEPAHPRFVVLVNHHSRARARQLDLEKPRVFVIHRADPRNRVLAILGPDRSVHRHRAALLPVIDPGDGARLCRHGSHRVRHDRFTGLDPAELSSGIEPLHLGEAAFGDVFGISVTLAFSAGPRSGAQRDETPVRRELQIGDTLTVLEVVRIDRAALGLLADLSFLVEPIRLLQGTRRAPSAASRDTPADRCLSDLRRGCVPSGSS